jgi:RNA polymerase sigma factor (sigma-70 family)
MSAPFPQALQNGGGEFTTTHWSIVLHAGDSSSEQAERALEQLCATYWYPLYAYVRRQGRTADEAQDLTQEFFARLLQKKSLRLADPERGRFRTFLLSSLRNFLTSEWEKARAQKRGGGHIVLSLDEQDAEGRYLAEPVDGMTPERIFEKRWAATLLKRAMAKLRETYSAENKRDLFEALSPFLADEIESGYAGLSGKLGMSEGALRTAMHRMREAFRETLRDEVAMTVESPGEVEMEIRHLMAALRA